MTQSIQVSEKVHSQSIISSMLSLNSFKSVQTDNSKSIVSLVLSLNSGRSEQTD